MDEQIETQPQNLNPFSRPHRITPWVALVIIAAIAATVGYLVWAKAHEAWPFDYDGPWSEVKRGSPSTPLGTTGDYTGWKTYRNEEYGYQVQFPQASKLNVFDIDFTPTNVRAVDVLPVDARGIEITNQPVHVVICKGGCGTLGGPGTESIISKDKIIIDDKSYDATVIFSNSSSSTNKLLSIILPSNIEIRYSFRSDYGQPFTGVQIDSYDKSAIQILSTFKFIE